MLPTLAEQSTDTRGSVIQIHTQEETLAGTSMKGEANNCITVTMMPLTPSRITIDDLDSVDAGIQRIRNTLGKALAVVVQCDQIGGTRGSEGGPTLTIQMRIEGTEGREDVPHQKVDSVLHNHHRHWMMQQHLRIDDVLRGQVTDFLIPQPDLHPQILSNLLLALFRPQLRRRNARTLLRLRHAEGAPIGQPLLQ